MPSPFDDPSFGHIHYGFTCPNCKKEIAISTTLPILPPETGETTFDLRCPHPQCEWVGTINAREAYPV
jgi:hypothetical protein